MSGLDPAGQLLVIAGDAGVEEELVVMLREPCLAAIGPDVTHGPDGGRPSEGPKTNARRAQCQR